MNRYRGWETPGGVVCCYAVEPTFRCPRAEMATALDAVLAPAAELLGCGPDELLRMISRAHRNGGRRRRVDGKLTTICDTCGGKLERIGFRVYVERPALEDEITSSHRVGERLFGSPAKVQVKTSWCDTKREARQWARDEFEQATMIAAEAVA